MRIEQMLTIDLRNTEPCPEIRAKQGDMATRYLRIGMTCGGTPYVLPQGASAHFRCLKPDGCSVLNPAQLNGDGTVTVELTDQTLAVPGYALADLCLMDGEGRVLSTMSFRIRVEPAPLGVTAASESEVLTLMELIRRAENLKPGDSAYESAVKLGFEGSEAEWLASLVGPTGQTGPQGIPGQIGPQGPMPQPGVDYFTGEDREEFLEEVLAELPVSVAEDGFTDFTGLRRLTGMTMTRTEDGSILVEASMEGGRQDTAVFQLDGTGKPDKVLWGTMECALNWSGFDYDTLDVWEGGSY